MKHLIAIAALLLPLFAANAQQRSLSIDTPMGAVYGTLLTPESGSRTVALIIAGSGPTDRNGNGQTITTNSYRMIADSLCAHGIASLRYDKRGIGESASPMATNEALRFEDYINDANSWVDELSSEGFEKIVIVGHSEGAQIAVEVAATNPKVSGVVSVAGAAHSADVTLMRQLGELLTLPQMLEVAPVIATLKAGNTTTDFPPAMISLFHPTLQPYMISWFRYDPSSTIAKLTQKVLIVQGTTDTQVLTADAEALKRACPKARLVIIEQMNHTLKTADKADRNAQMPQYTDPSIPLHPDLMPAITTFIEEL